jgi:hypothetical protein
MPTTRQPQTSHEDSVVRKKQPGRLETTALAQYAGGITQRRNLLLLMVFSILRLPAKDRPSRKLNQWLLRLIQYLLGDHLNFRLDTQKLRDFFRCTCRIGKVE